MYNTRNSYNRNANQAARYNNTGTFVAANQQGNSPQQPQQNYQTQPAQQQQQQQSPQQTQHWKQQQQQQQQQQQVPQQQQVVPEPVPAPEPVMPEAKVEDEAADGGESVNGKSRPKWKKSTFKVNMREKRRRQNKKLRRLLTPKNALMVLNELAPGSQHEYSVVAEAEGYGSAVSRQYVALLNVSGIEYRGTGSTKLLAKNMAAENVIRDMIIKQMSQPPEPAPLTEDVKMENESDETKSTEGEESFPMIQLASYALHKLFSEWQTEGFKVPQLQSGKAGEAGATAAGAVAAPAAPSKPKKVPQLPPNAEHLHPCMLLSQMRPGMEYSFLASEGVNPQQVFTMGVTVDGTTYIGKAQNKKEARKVAARKACQELFNIVYPPEDKPVPIEDL